MSLKAVPSSAKAAELAELVEQINARLQAGEALDPEEVLRAHPEHAEELNGLLPAIALLANLSRSAGRPVAPVHGVPPERIGDFRILREIGRGGMGGVYEAVQVSLGRHVALEVLPVEAARDAKLLARFRRESQAAAQLHHSNIVPVFEVGQQGDVCFYAMQYIQGQSLDQVIRELQQLRAGSASRPCPDAANSVAQSLLAGRFEQARLVNATLDYQPDTSGESQPRAEQTAETPAPSSLSLVASDQHLDSLQVARLGLQVAEALAYAHSRGVVHRDIKPSNLLLDIAGIVWVSDFGLAKTQAQVLTGTGDLVGTVRYMAPERFGGVCDARADVYALGLTLYELLLLRPAFDAPDRLRLIDQIGHQEPVRPRGVDPRIPRDLETILMKAIEKDPQRRYASADDLAEDLRRYLADEPIRARRIGPLERLGRWGRRNPLVAGLSAAIIVVTALGFVGVLGQWQVALAHEQQSKEQRDEAQQQRDETQRQRDEVKALNEKLAAKEQQLQRTLYAAHMNLAQHAWDVGAIGRVDELLRQHHPMPGETDLRGFEWYYLFRLCHAEVLTIKGAVGSMFIKSVAYSPDGKRLAGAGGSRDPTLKVWDAQTGQVLLSLKGGGSRDGNFSKCVAFSPDGKRLAGISGGTTGAQQLKVWDAQTGQELLTLQGVSASVACSPDGKRLASAGWTLKDGKIGPSEAKIWDAETGRELLTLKGARGGVAFSPDGKRLASGTKVWDAQSGQELLSLKGHTGGSVSSVAYSPDGTRIATASYDDKTLKVWDAQTGQELLSIKGSNGYGVAFSPDGKRLAGASEDNAVKVWDAQTGQELHSLKGHEWVSDVAFSPDGKRLVSGGDTVKVWDAQRDPRPRTLKGSDGYVTTSLAFSPDGKRLASGSVVGPPWTASGPGEGKVWDAQTGQVLVTLRGAFGSLAYNPDGKRLAGASEDQMMNARSVKVWDAQTGQELLSLPFKGLGGGRVSVAFSPDGRRVAASGGEKGPGGGPGGPGEVKVWDAQTGQELLTVKHTAYLARVAFSPDGKRLASAARDRTVRVWDAQTGQELLSFQGASGWSVAFSPDGKRLACGSRVWDAETGRELLALKGHADWVPSVAFSPDGKRLATVSADKTVKVWDAETGSELLTVPGGGSGAIYGGFGIAFSPDGHHLTSGMEGGAVTIYDATPLPEKP
ncbi:MAG TPA: protein kinase [Gemmataceae bacterium]|nr:protein kinase [Gemmataceae bacterium]